jgi:hypothetical protein
MLIRREPLVSDVTWKAALELSLSGPKADKEN